MSADTGTLAFHLNLPTLHGVEVRTLLKIRSDERPAFEKFRRALVQAMDDRLANNKAANLQEIANEIRRDVLDPALDDIELRLKRAAGALTEKAATSIAIGSLPTICGLYTATPLLIAAGITPVITTLINATHKYIEEKRDVALSDMFFLWEAQRHALRHAA
jgi:hypothetical protein